MLLLQGRSLMPVVILAFALMVLLSACGTKERTSIRLQGDSMGTTWHITLVPKAGSNQKAPELQAGIEQILVRIDEQMSNWRKDSEISRFNQTQTTDWFPVSLDLVKVIEAAQQVSQLSKGVYDITVGPLVNLWGFGSTKNPEAKPADADIKLALAKVGYQKLSTQESPPALRKAHPDMYVDLASIAPGYAVDLIGNYFEQQGITDYMVELGGEVRTLGKSPRGDDWRIGIEKPIDLGHAVQQGMLLMNSGLSTSGDYRDFFIENGKRYSHTIDTTTGYTASHNLASVSVVADNTTLADGYSTMLMAMGEVKGKAFADQQQLKAYFIWRTDQGFETYATSGFQPLLLKH
ncbi:MAG TPA: FAD:protein FMN transferase [Thiolinea sp.]|nr:FAD:protein FMN transferase [Thiolinea sp.]